MRKFEVLSVELSPGGPGPEQAWSCTCRYIKGKQWVETKLWSVARNAQEAKRDLEQRYGGKN